MACKYTYNGVEYSKEQLVSKLSNENSNFNTLYNNLVNEITNTETGRKVLDRIKRDYNYKDHDYNIVEDEMFGSITYSVFSKTKGTLGNFNTIEEAQKEFATLSQNKYTLEEQQEEAVVEIIGLYSAQKLDKLKDKTLIQLIKELLKEMSDFVKLIFKKEINITKDLDNISELTDIELNKLLKNGEITKKC